MVVSVPPVVGRDDEREAGGVAALRERQETGEGGIRREGRVEFTVSDAGDPVPGALVKIDGRTDTTNAEGVAAIRLGPYNRARRLTATATKAGYTRGKTTVRVRV